MAGLHHACLKYTVYKQSQIVNRKVTLVIAGILLLFNLSTAQTSGLRFNDEGRFKIAQFTDMHLTLGQGEYRDAQAEKTFARLRRVVLEEKPDLLVFTGDIVTEGVASRSWNRLIDTLNMHKVPFCVMFGNHDPEREMSRAEMSAVITSSPYSLNKLDSDKELADMELEVGSSSGDDVPFVIYCMDSHDYSTIEGVGGYGWFELEQIEWLRNSCNNRTINNGGKPVNSMAFFHICLMEYESAWADGDNPRVGRRAENECPAALNTGMFAAMVQTGSVMGIFVGHDHDNDYVVAEKGVALGYGRFSGDDTTYNNLRPGVRLISVQEGRRAFESWILEDDGRVADRMLFEDGTVKRIR